jgi:hypothetical protein
MANAKIVNTPSQAIPQSGAPHTQVTVGSTAGALIGTLTLHAYTTHVLIQFTGANTRVTFDGTNPTTSKGFVYSDGSTAYLTRSMASAAKAIRDDSTDVVVEIQELNFL